MKKIIYIMFGCLSVGLGAIGAIMPILPTFPFLLFAAFCFARSSSRLETWFKNTNLYKNNLESYVEGKGMNKKTKCRIMSTVTFLMIIGCIMMGSKGVKVGCIVLFLVWLFHVLYFIFGIKTISVVEVKD